MSGVWVGPSQDAEQPEFRRPKSCPIGAYRGVFTGDMAAVSDGRLAQDVDASDLLDLPLAPTVAELALHGLDERTSTHRHTLGP